MNLMNQSNMQSLNHICSEYWKNNNFNLMNLKLFLLLSDYLILKEKALSKLRKWKGYLRLQVFNSEKNKLKTSSILPRIKTLMPQLFTMKIIFQDFIALLINIWKMLWKVILLSNKKNDIIDRFCTFIKL